MQGMGGGCEASNTITESETLSSHNNMEEKAGTLRVSMELEFVQCLANPRYLQCIFVWG